MRPGGLPRCLDAAAASGVPTRARVGPNHAWPLWLTACPRAARITRPTPSGRLSLGGTANPPDERTLDGLKTISIGFVVVGTRAAAESRHEAFVDVRGRPFREAFRHDWGAATPSRRPAPQPAAVATRRSSVRGRLPKSGGWQSAHASRLPKRPGGEAVNRRPLCPNPRGDGRCRCACRITIQIAALCVLPSSMLPIVAAWPGDPFSTAYCRRK
jgi:hypothetical protein